MSVQKNSGPEVNFCCIEVSKISRVGITGFTILGTIVIHRQVPSSVETSNAVYNLYVDPLASASNLY